MTINIHGKEYTEVKDRIPLFWQKHESGCINTDIVEITQEHVVIKAFLYANQEDTRPLATGLAQEFKTSSHINKTSYVENCETSAIGRALANYDMAGGEQRPSAEEMQKVDRVTKGQLHNKIAELCRAQGKEITEIYDKTKEHLNKKELDIDDYKRIIIQLEKGQK